MPGANLDWQDGDRLLAIIERCLERSSTYLVESAELTIPRTADGKVVRIAGRLRCKGGLVIDIDDRYEVGTGGRIRGVQFKYQALFADPPLRPIFRYDNAHIYAHEGHPDAFHKHVFSPVTWEQTEIVHIGRDGWPTLQQVIDEVFDWWRTHRDDPRIYPRPR